MRIIGLIPPLSRLSTDAQLTHAVTFAAHHAACIALVSKHFPGRLRGRGQALYSALGYGLSRNHLMKIVHDLGRQGLLQTTRGRSGGLRLGREAERITVGDVVRATETDFRQAECFDAAHSQCTLRGDCGLQGVLQQALAAYFAVLNHTTLADISAPRAQPVRFMAAITTP